MDPILGKGIDKIIEGASKEPVETFSKTWELVFGKFHLYVDKVIYQREVEFEKFKEQFKKEISSVPENNLQEPQFSLLGPALEASKFYISEKTLSNMFAKLIASSMDDRKNSLTHHSFVEIIKQLSPNDAILLKHLKNHEVHPAVKYRAVLNPKNDGMNISDTLIKDSPLDIESTEISINNLVRLGVLNETFDMSYLTKKGIYNKFYAPQFLNHFNKIIEKQRFVSGLEFVKRMLKSGHNLETISKLSGIEFEVLKLHYSPWVIDIKKGSISLSAYGKAFVKTCIN
ncbi:TPA: DUF4393 domain-containing protein [Staphylococcus aureus]|nr:DUF4393 domain-containing protein [Staphylococcus aureus]